MVNSPLVTKLALNHHTRFGLTADAEYIPTRVGTIHFLAINRTGFSRSRLYRHARLISQIET